MIDSDHSHDDATCVAYDSGTTSVAQLSSDGLWLGHGQEFRTDWAMRNTATSVLESPECRG